MYMLWGEQKSMTSPDNFPTVSVIKTNNGDLRGYYIPGYSGFNNNWYQNDEELRRHYWAASFLLPLGSIFVLSIVVLLMVLFKRCPHIIAGVVAGLLGTIIIFVIVMSINNAPVYS